MADVEADDFSIHRDVNGIEIRHHQETRHPAIHRRNVAEEEAVERKPPNKLNRDIARFRFVVAVVRGRALQRWGFQDVRGFCYQDRRHRDYGYPIRRRSCRSMAAEYLVNFPI